MSHWTRVATEIRDIDALREACEALDLQLVKGGEGRGHYNRVFDWVIRLPGSHDVGLSKVGMSQAFTLHFDDWQGAVARTLGKNCGMLLQSYAEVMIRKAAGSLRKRGRIDRRVREDGAVVLTVHQ